jgi:hypothetical protein
LLAPLSKRVNRRRPTRASAVNDLYRCGKVDWMSALNLSDMCLIRHRLILMRLEGTLTASDPGAVRKISHRRRRGGGGPSVDASKSKVFIACALKSSRRWQDRRSQGKEDTMKVRKKNKSIIPRSGDNRCC